MKLSEFILLSEAEKKLTVLHYGVLIAKRMEGDQFIFLFQIDNYYVEAYCNTDNKSVQKFIIFTDTMSLHPYLEMISIDDLLN